MLLSGAEVVRAVDTPAGWRRESLLRERRHRTRAVERLARVRAA